MNIFILLITISAKTSLGKFTGSEKRSFCAALNCENEYKRIVCGIRAEGSGFRLRVFTSECELIAFGCTVEEIQAYGIINMDVCKEAFNEDFQNKAEANHTEVFIGDVPTEPERSTNLCPTQCPPSPDPSNRVCAWAQHGAGFKIRLFNNKCALLKFNCDNKLKFDVTDRKLCNDIELTDETEKVERSKLVNGKTKPLIVVDLSMFNLNGKINDTVDNFFAATHINDIPLARLLPEDTRRMRLRTAAANVVFKPLIDIPKNINETEMNRPTMSTCFHTCPLRCPEEYAPVCAVAGYGAREPAVVFKNHCYMDAAQCLMKFEDPDSIAAYVESSFVMCLGDGLSGVYRFLPLVRTLQHMGRLKKLKKNFNYKVRNMRYLSNYLQRDIRLMGK